MPDPSDPPRLTHLDETGAARMVDVTAKSPTVRTASATAFVACSPRIVAALCDGSVPKGDVLAVARVAGIAAAKRTPELLPLAHVIGVHGGAVDLVIEEEGVRISTTVRTADRTGVEMEALTAATVAGLAIVDMVKPEPAAPWIPPNEWNQSFSTLNPDLSPCFPLLPCRPTR